MTKKVFIFVFLSILCSLHHAGTNEKWNYFKGFLCCQQHDPIHAVYLEGTNPIGRSVQSNGWKNRKISNVLFSIHWHQNERVRLCAGFACKRRGCKHCRIYWLCLYGTIRKIYRSGKLYGRTGLAFSASDFFFSIELVEISTSVTTEEFDRIANEHRNKSNDKLLNYHALLKAKDNTISMMERWETSML